MKTIQQFIPTHRTEPEKVKYDGEAGTWLTLQRLCPPCLGIAARQREEAEERERNTALWTAYRRICPPLYIDTDVKRLSSILLARVMAWQYGPKGMLITSASGAGKTRCVFQLIRRLIREGHRVQALDANQFTNEVGRRFGDNDSPTLWLNQLATVPVLFLDDFLGKGRITDRVEAEFFALIERRAAYYRPTLLTVNGNSKTILASFSADRGAPLLRRLREFCDCISWDGTTIIEDQHG